MRTRPFAWEKSYPEGLKWDHPLPIGSVPSLLQEAAAKVPDRDVICYRDWTISYGDLQKRVDKFAAACIAAGFTDGKRIALLLPNSPFHPIALLGLLKAGARAVHLSPLDAEREIVHKLTDSGAIAIVTTNVGPMAANAHEQARAGRVGKIIVGDDNDFGPSQVATPFPKHESVINFNDFCDRAESVSDWPEIKPEDIALLQYTGGTTGLPKGAMLTHGNLTSAVSSYNCWFDALYGEPDEVEKILVVLPLFHIYALTAVMLLGFKRHGTLILHLRFDAEHVLNDIEKIGITSFPGVPTMWIALANNPGLAKRNISSLARCSSGGAPLPVEIEQRFEKLTGVRLTGGWGMTETSPAGTNRLPFGMAKPGSIGLPLPGIDLKIVSLDDPTKTLGIGEKGELAICGPNVTSGYWEKPEATAQSYADGFFLTGDVGMMDKDGYFYIVDRKKDMIISGGFNVYPQMIEQAIYEFPPVGECIVIGVADEYRGEAAKAYLTLKPGAAEFSLDELHAFLADKLGRHELPRALEFRETLPRTSVGKLSRLELRREAQNIPAASTAAAD